MFPFHKPKVYRSIAGCCICKAKSSSSRFTDSKKYENAFVSCFQLSTPRQGEICNACVLLVKRFKRLPPGSTRHWGHVVDARAGPGIKCMNKVKKRCQELQKNPKECEGNVSEEEEMWSEDEAGSDEEVVPVRKRKIQVPVKNHVNSVHNLYFVNRRYWKKVSVCRTDVWKNVLGQVILDLSSYRPCPIHSTSVREEIIETKIQDCERTALPGKLFNENSSDSGYDESVVSSQDLPVIPIDADVQDKKPSNNVTIITYNISSEKYQRLST